MLGSWDTTGVELIRETMFENCFGLFEMEKKNQIKVFIYEYVLLL